MEYRLQKGEVVLLTIKRLGINGEGIGFYKRQVVFVEGALPGEVVEVKVRDANEKFVYADITKFKKYSEDRVEPRCPYYEKCGGCQLQHLSYKAQLKEKRNLVIEAFEKYYQGDLDKIEFKECIGMKDDKNEYVPWFYRNKSALPVRHDGEHVVCGMYAINSNMLVYIEDCLIENEKINETRKKILSILDKENVSIYNPKLHSGSLRYLVIRAFPNSDEVQVTFVLTRVDNKLINILKHLPVKSANYSINDDFKSVEIFGSEVVNVKGESLIKGKLKDLVFEISPQAFFQLNSLQTTHLYDEIIKASDLNKNMNVLDLYCGIGSISMYLAPYVKEVRGIDINGEGIVNAINFAKKNNINNAFFYKGYILPHLHKFEKDGFKADLIVLDPPRKGLELNIINHLQNSHVKKVVYVSCNPATLAKNLNHLQKAFSIKYVQPLDMFPHTSNVEAVCLLVSKNKN